MRSCALECTKVESVRETHSPVGCSYLPAAGVSRVTETDILDMSVMINIYIFLVQAASFNKIG